MKPLAAGLGFPVPLHLLPALVGLCHISFLRLNIVDAEPSDPNVLQHPCLLSATHIILIGKGALLYGSPRQH